MEILENVSLKKYNTFAVEAKADYFVSINNLDDIRNLLNTQAFADEKRFVLGGGSNILLVGDFHGLVIDINIKGIRIKEQNDDYLILETGAGENWNAFVKTCVKSNYYGLENLALIPGKTGAAPVQNIGAYGAEQKDVFVSLEGIDLITGEISKLNYDDCKFSYRNSVFKNELQGKFIVTTVSYKLSRNENFNFSYKQLKQEIEKFPGANVDLQYVHDTVCRIRKSKLPDINQIGSAGSFFKNPIINENIYDELKKIFPTMNAYPLANHRYKLSAGWLIEQCGWKGKRFGDAGVYDRHALVLVNYANAKGEEIYKLAMDIRDSVNDKFGISLEPEVLIIGEI